ncbi:MAG: ECF transporter S component [Desulfurococcales archaeon]|nr:ECF transporter S component [Desulfurococcales archaeon]
MDLGPRTLALAAVFTALVFAATLISVSTPITGGYFNLGESMVYTAALLGGPIVGGIAGGLGSSLADLYLGYSQYAPGTLVIKGVEGLLAGVIYERLRRYEGIKGFTPIIALIVGLGILVAGMAIYGGVYGGATQIELWGRVYEIRIPGPAWLAIASATALAIIYIGERRGPRAAAMAVAMLIAGMEMVAGYFIYEATILGYGISAAAEIPINIGQALIGAAAAFIIVNTVREAQAG